MEDVIVKRMKEKPWSEQTHIPLGMQPFQIEGYLNVIPYMS